MHDESFSALIVEEETPGQFIRRIGTRRIEDLPDGDVLVRVHYSSVNYKDALSATGHAGVTRRYPHTPGIDAAGVVISSRDPAWQAGDEIIVTGFDLGMNTPGGLGAVIRVPATWIVRKPDTLSLRACMMLGTAGFTAALALDRMQRHGLAASGEVVVTGATGGVGQCAVALLAGQGYRVTAVTGKSGQEEALKRLGAIEVIDRKDFNAMGQRPIAHARWTGGVDTVGGEALDAMLKSAALGGVVAACGLAATADLNTNVYPFILRGVSLIGIDSAETPVQTKARLWSLLAGPWRIERLDAIAREVSLNEVGAVVRSILNGTHRGRTVVRLPDYNVTSPDMR